MSQADEQLYGLMEIAERQQAAVQTALDGLAAERATLTREREQLVQVRQALEVGTRAAVRGGGQPGPGGRRRGGSGTGGGTAAAGAAGPGGGGRLAAGGAVGELAPARLGRGDDRRPGGAVVAREQRRAVVGCGRHRQRAGAEGAARGGDRAAAGDPGWLAEGRYAWEVGAVRSGSPAVHPGGRERRRVRGRWTQRLPGPPGILTWLVTEGLVRLLGGTAKVTQ